MFIGETQNDRNTVSLAKSILKNTFWLALAQFFNMGFGAIVTILLARYLGDVDYGKYVFAISFTNLFIVIADFGFAIFLINEVARDKSSLQLYFGNILSLKAIISILYLLVVALLINLSGKSFEIQLYVYLSAFTHAFISFVNLFYAIFQAHEKMKHEAVFSGIASFLNFVFILGAVILKMKLIYIFEFILATNLLNLIFAFIFVHRKYIRLKFEKDFKLWKRLMIQIFPFTLCTVFVSVYYYIAQVILSFMKGDEITGWYGAVYRILLVLISLSGIYINVYHPVIARLYKTDFEKLKSIVLVSLRLAFAVTIPTALGLTILAKPIISLFFGNEFLGGASAMQILVWTIVIILFSQIFGRAIQVSKNMKAYTFAISSGTLVSIAANFILIPRFSLEGAAVATILAELAVAIFMYIIFSKRIFRVSFLQYSIKPLVAVIIMGAVVWLLKENNYNLVLTVVGGATVYLLTLFLIGGIKKEEIILLKNLIKKER